MTKTEKQLIELRQRVASRLGEAIAKSPFDSNTVYRVHQDTGDVWFCTTDGGLVNYGPLAEFVEKVKAGKWRAILV